MKLDIAETVLIGINLILGIIFSFIISQRILRYFKWENKKFTLIIVLLLLYLIEGITIAAGMLTPFFTFGLAIIIGIVFGYIIKKKELHKIVKSTLLLSFFLCIPAITLIMIPIVCFFSEWNIINSIDGYRFGIPEFIPYPLNTILGFYLSIITLFITINLLLINGIVNFIKNIYELRLKKG